MAVELTPNSIVALTNGEENLKPVLQVLDLKQIGGTQPGKPDRFRMVISDGSFSQQAMLATQLNEHVHSGALKKGSIIQLTECICNSVHGRKIVIVLNMEIINMVGEMIGNPRQLPDSNAQQQAAPQVLQQAAHQAPLQSAHQIPRQAAPQQAAPYSMQQQAPVQAHVPSQNYGSTNDTGFRAGGNFNSTTNGPSTAGFNPVANAGSYSRPMNGRPDYIAGNFLQNSTSSGGNPVQNSVNSGMGTTAGRGMNPQSNVYGRQGGTVSYQPPPVYSNRGPISRNEAPARIIPISALNPYQNRWTIKARVTSKGDRRRFNNARGDGQVFSFDLLDSEGGEIRVTCFNSVVDQFYDRVESGRVYLISKGSLKPAQKPYNHLPNEWEIFLETSSTVDLCQEEDNSIPVQNFNFRPISLIENMDSNSTVDIIGVVYAVNPSTTIMKKNGTETLKRTLQIKDNSGCSVELTMWGSFCNNEGQELQRLCDEGATPVVALKSGRISDFSGRSVGTIMSSQILINPNLPEKAELVRWYEIEGKNGVSQSLTREFIPSGRPELRKTVTQIKDEGLGKSEKPDWVSIRATLSFVKVDNFCYTACPGKVGDRTCSKKVSNNGDGTWQCERCDRSFDECDYRYLLQAQIQDHTGVTWITAFQEAGEEIMGTTAKELYRLKHEIQDDVQFADVIRKVLFNQYLFKLKVKEETFSDEQRVKSTVVKVDRIDYSSESKILLDLIGKLSRGESINPPTVPYSNPATNFVQGYSGHTNRVNGSNSMGFGNNGYSGSRDGGYSGNAGGYGGMAGGNFNASGSSMAGGNFNTNGSSNACFKCGQGGHFARECPNAGGGGGGGGGFSGNAMGGGFGNTGTGFGSSCHSCGQAGHWAKDCPRSASIPAAYGGGNASGSYGMRGGSFGNNF